MSFNSPSQIKENLENKMNKLNSGGISGKQQYLQGMKPNVSPFDDYKDKANLEEQDTMVVAHVNPLDRISQDFNILKSIDFN